MENKNNIIITSKEINLMNNNKDTNDETNKEINAQIYFHHNITIKIDEKNITVLDLKNQIGRNLSLKSNEYQLFISQSLLDDSYNKILIKNLVENFKTNIFIIKSNKNAFDIQKQLQDYEKYLSNSISMKEEEIQVFNLEYERLKNDLKNMS